MITNTGEAKLPKGGSGGFGGRLRVVHELGQVKRGLGGGATFVVLAVEKTATQLRICSFPNQVSVEP